MRKKIFRFVGYTIGSLGILFLGIYTYLLIVATVTPPQPGDLSPLEWKRSQIDSGMFKLKNCWLRKSQSGLYEMYVEGDPFTRGVVMGKLTRELAQYQEEAFVNQLYQIVPSKFKIRVLKYFVGWFNRNMDESIPEEYKLEIYGESTEASKEYDFIAPAYQRMLNYHGAHDIGHALQNMSLVGCTSFALWGDRTEDGKLLLARNFDFYVGDDFAKNKIVAFYRPSEGHPFMMVTFGGMAGALSGMNVKGLTVTINAAKSEIPSSGAMPVSLVAREILQYASNIKEALAIAKKREMFVAETFLIGSAHDGKAAVIEKSPEATDLFVEEGNQLICTNHFQGKKLGDTDLNREHIRTSASMYRWKRVQELLSENNKMSVQRAVEIMRNQKGLAGADIGLGNEKAINQLIAHHSIIFQPEDLKVWVSTAPYQLGKYVCYDLTKVLESDLIEDQEICEQDLTIEKDPFVNTQSFVDFQKFARYRFPFNPRTGLQPDSLVKWNPESYLSYMLAGDATFKNQNYKSAKEFYERGLHKEVATLQERDYMMAQIEKCKKELE